MADRSRVLREVISIWSLKGRKRTGSHSISYGVVGSHRDWSVHCGRARESSKVKSESEGKAGLALSRTTPFGAPSKVFIPGFTIPTSHRDVGSVVEGSGSSNGLILVTAKLVFATEMRSCMICVGLVNVAMR